jgi:hypothetical protein
MEGTSILCKQVFVGLLMGKEVSWLKGEAASLVSPDASIALFTYRCLGSLHPNG